MTAATQTHAEVSQLYVALFGRAPEADGLNFWAGLRDSGQTMTQLADAMFATTPARTYFPSTLTHQEIISSFYFNVLGRQADASGLAFWTAKLDAAGATSGSVIAEMISVIAHYGGTDPAGLTSAALFNNRSAAAQFFGEHSGSLANATTVLAGVTADPTSVAAATTLTLGATAKGAFDAGGYANVAMGLLAGDVTFNNVVAGTGISFTASPQATNYFDQANPPWKVTYSLADSNGSSDSVTVTLTSTLGVEVGKLETPGVEHLEFVSRATAPGEHHLVTLADPAAVSVTVTGDGAFWLESASTTTALRSVDASQLNAGVSYWSSTQGGSTTMTGGAHNDFFGTDLSWNDAASDDHIFAGAGDDVIFSGRGRDVLSGGAGSDEFYIDVNTSRAIYTTIAGFTRTSVAEKGDRVWTHGLAKWGSASLQGDAVVLGVEASINDYLNQAAGTDISAFNHTLVTWFHYLGDTYVVFDNSNATYFDDGVDQIVKFTGQVDIGSDVKLAYNNLIAPGWLSGF